MPFKRYNIDPDSQHGQAVSHGLRTGMRAIERGEGHEFAVVEAILAYAAIMVVQAGNIQEQWIQLARRNAYWLIASVILNVAFATTIFILLLWRYMGV